MKGKNGTGSKADTPQGRHAATPANAAPSAAGGTTAFRPAGVEQGSRGKGYGVAPEPPKNSGKKIPLIVLGVIVLVLAVVYGGGALFFSGHFFPNTKLNNEDVSLQASSSLAQRIQDQADSYTLTISGKGFTLNFGQGETAIQIDAAKIASDAAANQDIALWFIEVFKDHDISDVVVASYEEGSIDSVIKEKVEAFNMNQDPSKNATVTYSESVDAFVPKAEVYGNQIDADKVCQKAGECLREMRSECTVTDDELIKPKVLSSDARLATAVQQANSLFPNSLSLMLNGTVKAATIDKATFGSWIYVNPDDYSLVINQDMVTEWVEDKASGMNTVGTTRSWTREDGKACTASGGTYGWKVDTATLAQDTYNALVAGGATTVNIACSQTGDVYNGAGQRDWGAYVDVDLTEQTARYYDASGNLLHSCGIVSGKPVEGRATPTGVYYLNNKQSPSTLIGYKSNGEKDYETKVTYWMPFVGNSVGLHDATWQSSFGGTRYQTNGSHGCVNLSVSDAQWFYENLSKGVCIITHN